jgi:hypothetical protein
MVITISKENYESKPTSYNTIKLVKSEITDVKDLSRLISNGYGICSCNLKSKNNELGFQDKKKENFAYSHLLVFDIDEEKFISPSKFFEDMPQEDKPSYLYTSYSHSEEQIKYHLIYIYKEKIESIEQYKVEYDRRSEQIKQVFPNIKFDNSCRSGVQYLNGSNFRLDDFEYHISNNVFTPVKLEENNMCPITNKYKKEKNHYDVMGQVNLNLSNDFLNDLKSLTYNKFIDKYKEKYQHLTQSQVEYDKEVNGIRYAQLDENFTTIQRRWVRDANGKYTQQKTKIGHRRHTLFKNGCVIRKIWLNEGYIIPDEHLIFCLICEYQFTMEHDDKENPMLWQEIVDIAKGVQQADISGYKNKQKIKIDPQHRGEINLKSASKKVQGYLTEKLVLQHCDITKSVRENVNILKEKGIKISKSTIHRYINKLINKQ